MNPVRVVLVAILVTALVTGVAIYWLQEYAFYRELSPAGTEGFELTLADGTRRVVPVQGFRGIDSNSSPIRYRACFTLDAPASDFLPYEGAEPRNAPNWFTCFDARAIGEALEQGEAAAVLGEPTGIPGVDRVVAIFPDGRAFAWHQPDPCGPLVDEDERPASCPEPLAPGEAAAVPAAVPPAEPIAEPGTP